MTATPRVEFTVTDPRSARLEVGRRLQGCDRAIETAQLLVSELVTNAMMHAGDEVVPISVELTAEHVTVRVSDDSPVAPETRPLDPGTPGGLGLRIVAGSADDWGVEQHRDDGKSVWFELACTESNAPDDGGEQR